MPLIFPRSRLSGKGTYIVERKEAVGEPHSIFSKVESGRGTRSDCQYCKVKYIDFIVQGH